jgi:Mrp family chromosome partitioning ATPase
VVDAGKTTKNQVKEALAMMQPTSCLGTVLNRYRGGLADSYGYGYGYGAYQQYYE